MPRRPCYYQSQRQNCSREIACYQGALGAPAIHEYAGDGTDQRHGKQEEDRDQRDGARRSMHAERHCAQHRVERQKIAEDADHLGQPKFPEGWDG